MTTATADRACPVLDAGANVFSRPAAQINDDGELVVRASSALGCRRALWYSATGYRPTNPPSDDSLTAMEAGTALEPVVVRAMERAGWRVDRRRPPGPGVRDHEARPQAAGDRTPRRYGAASSVRG